MRKIILTILVFVFQLLMCNYGQAQSRFDATAFVGLNMIQIEGDGAGSYNHAGLRAGVGTSFALGSDSQSPWRMVVQLAFSNKGSYVEQYDRSLSVSYVELPLLLSYNCLGNRLRVAAGVAPGVNVGANVTNSGVEDKLSEDNFTAMDWLPLTVSLGYRFTDHLGLEARYQNSMASVTKENGSGTYRVFRSNKGCFTRLMSFALTYTF